MQPQPTPLLRTTTHLRRVRARGTANFGNFQPGNPRAHARVGLLRSLRFACERIGFKHAHDHERCEYSHGSQR